MVQGLLFDMDGVLVDSAAAHQESWNRLLTHENRVLPESAFEDSFGRTTREILGNLFSDLTEERIREFDTEKERLYREIIADDIPLMPGALELLQHLRDRGLVLGVGTSGPPENLDLVLDRSGLRTFFTSAVHGFDVSHGKPAPDIFLEAARRANLDAAHCLVIEDAPAGIEAARRAGMRAIGVTSTHSRAALQETSASWIVDQLSEIPSLPPLAD